MAKGYISRSALLGYLNDIWLTATPTDSTPAEDRQFAICRCMGLQDAMDDVKEFPAADVVEVRHGRWNAGATGWECSVCTIESDNTYPHCPYCGAVMDGGQDDV